MCPECRIPFVLIVVVSVYSVYNSQLVEFDSDVVPLDNKIEFIRIDASARITSTILFREMFMNYIDSVSGWKAWKHDGGSVTFLLGSMCGKTLKYSFGHHPISIWFWLHIHIKGLRVIRHNRNVTVGQGWQTESGWSQGSPFFIPEDSHRRACQLEMVTNV